MSSLNVPDHSASRGQASPRSVPAAPQQPPGAHLEQPPPPYSSLPYPPDAQNELLQPPLYYVPLASVHSSPRPSAPPLDQPPCYSFRSHQIEIPGEIARGASALTERLKLVMHSYTLLLVLFLLTFSLVAVSKALPSSISDPVYQLPWLHLVSVAVVAASLVLMVSWNLAGQATVLNDILLLMLWAGTTLNLILVARPFSKLDVSLAACLMLVTVLALTFAAIQTKFDLTKHFWAAIALLGAVAVASILAAICFGEEVAGVAIQCSWLAAALVVLPLFAQSLVGDRFLSLHTDDFLLAVAVLYSMSMNLLQHGLLLSETFVKIWH